MQDERIFTVQRNRRPTNNGPMQQICKFDDHENEVFRGIYFLGFSGQRAGT
jgi:hypothetical protein